MSSAHNFPKSLKNARGFALVLLLLVLIAAFHLILTCNTIKTSLRFTATTESDQLKLQKAAFFCQSEQLALTRYLLAGDFGEIQNLEVARSLLRQIDSGENRRLKSLLDSENEWYRNFAQPLIAQRKALDAGHGTLSELQIRYVQAGSNAWAQKLSHITVFTEPDPSQAMFERLQTRISSRLDSRMVVGVVLCIIALLVAIVELRQLTRLEEALATGTNTIEPARSS